MFVTYIGPKSRTERPRKTKIGIEVAHVTRDLDTTFKVKRSKVDVWEGAGAYCGGLPHSLLSMSVVLWCLGVNSFQAYMSNEGHCSKLRDSDLYRLFRQCKQLNAVPLIHAENGTLIEEVCTNVKIWYVKEVCKNCWRFGVAVTRWSRSTQLLYIEPG